MSISAMKQALDAITNVLAGGDFDNPYADLKEAGAALQQAIAEAEKQEAVAWMWKDGTLTSDPDFADGTWTPLFAAPVACDNDIYDVWKEKKEWIGLDHEMMRNTPIEFNRGALWAERYLKEKNT